MTVSRPPQITANFDSGNIEVVDLSDTNNIQLQIRPDVQNPRFMQWFYFKLEGNIQEKYRINLINASKVTFPCWRQQDAPECPFIPYRAVASFNQENWFRIPTTYQNIQLTMEITLEEESAYIAFFAPYPYQKHQQLIATAAESKQCTQTSLGKSPEGRDITLLTIGEPDPNKKRCWFIARQHPGEPMAEWFMEGLIKRLLNKDDAVSQALLKEIVFYLVPNMNPDGTYHGNLRTNAKGIDLNRAWRSATATASPEVYYTLEAMRKTGVDFFMDVHGEEALPYVFLETRLGCSDNKTLQGIESQFIQRFMQANTHVQNKYKYGFFTKPGTADLNIANYYVAESFQCPSLLLEMPVKDDANHPEEKAGWSPETSMALGASVLIPLQTILQTLSSPNKPRENNEGRCCVM